MEKMKKIYFVILKYRIAFFLIALIAFFGTSFYLNLKYKNQVAEQAPQSNASRPATPPFAPKQDDKPTPKVDLDKWHPWRSGPRAECANLKGENKELVRAWDKMFLNNFKDFKVETFIQDLEEFKHKFGVVVFMDKSDAAENNAKLIFLTGEGACGEETYLTFSKLSKEGEIFYELDIDNKIITKWHLPRSGFYLTSIRGEVLNLKASFEPICELCDADICTLEVGAQLKADGTFSFFNNTDDSFDQPVGADCNAQGIESAYGRCMSLDDKDGKKRKIFYEAECT